MADEQPPLRKRLEEAYANQPPLNSFRGPAVALVGNLSEGWKVVGPFETWDDASDWADGVDSWIVDLISPEGYKEVYGQ